MCQRVLSVAAERSKLFALPAAVHVDRLSRQVAGLIGSEESHRCADFPRSPARPNEICERMPGNRSGRFITHAVISVSINPGWTQFTRMPCGVISADMLRVSASSPSFVGA